MSKKSLIDSIEVKTPCSENWDEMKGNEKVRFCAHCALEVNNISAMTRKQALRLVHASSGRICVRYIQNPVDKKPVFAGKLYQIARRSKLAAGVLGASLTLSSLTCAQGSPLLSKQNSETRVSLEKQLEEETVQNTFASVSGIILDPNGIVIPNITVMLFNMQTETTITATSNDEGVYRFENVAPGLYTIKVAPVFGFASKEITGIKVSDGDEIDKNISLDVKAANVPVVVGDAIFTDYENALARAVSGDNLEEVKNLIGNGKDINLADENYEGITPLFIAVENGNAEIAGLLLSYGAKVNYRNDFKQTPLMRLDEDANAELVRVLIKYGAKINLTDANGNTALILAASSVKTEVLQILLDHDARVNAQNKQGQTALMNAAYADNLESVRALLMAGADVNLKNKEGDTALDLTTSREIEELLESHGAVIEDN